MSIISSIFTDFLPTVAYHLYENCSEVLTNGFDERDHRPITCSHLNPYTQFERDPSGYYTDLSNGDRYNNDDPHVIRFKCLLLALATPIVHAISLVVNLANRIAKIISFAHFWYPSSQSFTERSWSFGKDVLRVAFTPIIYLGLELAALYGLILPNDGRKLYATLERCAFGKEFLAPCFQPYATYHLGGGTIGKANVW